MGRKERTDDHFRKRLRAERIRRDWSQSDLAKMLSDNDIPMHSTTIAKIEAGDRSVRIDEATGIADLLGLSLDGLLGRNGMEDDQSHAMTVLAEEARKLISDVADIMDRLRDAYNELENQFGFNSFDQFVAQGKKWCLGCLEVEHQRAMLMWTGRDLAMISLHKVMAGLTEVVTVRSMTPKELADHLQKIAAIFEEHATEWRAQAGVETDGRIEYRQIAKEERGDDEAQS